MLVVQSSQDQARYYSKIRIKRMIDASPQVRDRLSFGGRTTTPTTRFPNGMVLALAGHPVHSSPGVIFDTSH